MTRKTFYRKLRELTKKDEVRWSNEKLTSASPTAHIIRTVKDDHCPISFVYSKLNPDEKYVFACDAWNLGKNLGLTEEDIATIIGSADYKKAYSWLAVTPNSVCRRALLKCVGLEKEGS